MQTRPFARCFLTALAALACLCITATAAHAQTTVINTLPYTIASSGTYVLNSSLNSSQTTGTLILINASNVTIDFQDHYIAAAVGNTSQTTYGIFASEQSNITIKNGTVAYCSLGIYLAGNGTTTTNAVGARVQNMRVTYCYSQGILMANQPSSLVTGCQISQIGFSAATSAYGINVGGAGCTVESNQVSNVYGTTGANTYCIYSVGGSFAKNNKVSNAARGVYLGLYQDNLASNCTTPFGGGTDGGGNVSQ